MVSTRLKAFLTCAVLAYIVVSPAFAREDGAPSIVNPIKNKRVTGPVYPPWGEKRKAAEVFFKSGQYPLYIEQLERYSREGNLECRTQLAQLYCSGRIVQPDRAKALTMFKELTGLGYGPAAYSLGDMYLNGIGCAKDEKKAFDLYGQSARLGYQGGIFGLAYMYRLGKGCKKDYAKALALCNELCAKGSPFGLYGKSELFWKGQGIPQNFSESNKLLEKAADAGMLEAQSWLSERYYFGEHTPINYRLSRYWAERGSEWGDKDCQLQLSYLKLNGLGGTKDVAGGLSLLFALSEQSVPEAQNRLGHIYRQGYFVKKDLTAAKMWLGKAAERNYAASINELADMYFYGDGFPTNLEKAFELNMKVAQEESADKDARASCEYNVGRAYDRGDGVKQDKKQARIWYEKAAAGGNPHACNNLSVMYEEGDGVPINKAMAISLRIKGVKNGCWTACNNRAGDYELGENGVHKNMREAVRLYKRSLQLNNENKTANGRLATIYEKGLAGKVDKKLFHKYLADAARCGDNFALRRVANEQKVSFNALLPKPEHWSKHVKYGINPCEAKYFVHVPYNFKNDQKAGLVVFMAYLDASTYIPYGWAEMLAKHNLFFITPQNAGAQHDTALRSGLAVFGAQEMIHKYNIDKSRVYVAGCLGDATLASEIAFWQSDIFRGTIQCCGGDFYRPLKPLHPMKTDMRYFERIGWFDLPKEDVEDVRKNVKFALITGPKDAWRPYVLNVYEDGFVKDHFAAKLFESDSVNGSDCDGEAFEKALNFLDKPGLTQ